jgi:hypothetical protein
MPVQQWIRAELNLQSSRSFGMQGHVRPICRRMSDTTAHCQLHWLAAMLPCKVALALSFPCAQLSLQHAPSHNASTVRCMHIASYM